jgi:hypothetical protein
VLKEAIKDINAILQEKQLSPASHSASANARSAPPDPSLLDLPCVLDDFELGKLKVTKYHIETDGTKTLRASKLKSASVSVPKPSPPPSPTNSPGVEAIIFRLVRDISDILYVVQIPIHVSFSNS